MNKDPLGIAIQQTFGIGLGFNFDHMTKLKKNEIPSIRRLQARAAKSALYRANQIRNHTNTFDEMEWMTSRLTELVPNDMSLANTCNTTIEQFYDYDDDYERASSNEYVIRPRTRKDSSQAIERLMKQYYTSTIRKNTEGNNDDDDYLNPFQSEGNNNTPLTSIDVIDVTDITNQEEELTDEDFIDLWMQNQRNTNATTKSSSPSLDDDAKNESDTEDNEFPIYFV